MFHYVLVMTDRCCDLCQKLDDVATSVDGSNLLIAVTLYQRTRDVVCMKENVIPRKFIWEFANWSDSPPPRHPKLLSICHRYTRFLFKLKKVICIINGVCISNKAFIYQCPYVHKNVASYSCKAEKKRASCKWLHLRYTEATPRVKCLNKHATKYCFVLSDIAFLCFLRVYRAEYKMFNTLRNSRYIIQDNDCDDNKLVLPPWYKSIQTSRQFYGIFLPVPTFCLTAGDSIW